MVKAPERTEDGISACRKRLEEAVLALNGWNRLDPVALQTLASVYVPCNRLLEATPMDISLSSHGYQVSGLGLVNGFFAFTYEHEGRIRYSYIKAEGRPVKHFTIVDEEVHDQQLNTIQTDSKQDIS
jgi:hypothetical protein